MTVYVLAQLRIHDPDRYGRYVRAFGRTLQPFDGRLLAADPRPQVLEGDAAPDKVVLIEFADRAALDAWAGSDDYRAIAADRRAATDGIVLALRGVTA